MPMQYEGDAKRVIPTVGRQTSQNQNQFPSGPASPFRQGNAPLWNEEWEKLIQARNDARRALEPTARAAGRIHRQLKVPVAARAAELEEIFLLEWLVAT